MTPVPSIAPPSAESISVERCGAKGDGSHDDTAAIQAAIDTGRRVFMPNGDYKITAPLVISRIGQSLEGEGFRARIIQHTSGASGIQLRIGSDDLNPGGSGIYFNQLCNFALEAANANTGTGIDIQDASNPNNDVHNGDYLFLERLFIPNWHTGIHAHSMAMIWTKGVDVTATEDQRGTYGMRVTGGSANSHNLRGLTISHQNTGLSLESSNLGCVYELGDFGLNKYHVVCETAAGGTFIGGNFEAYDHDGRAYWLKVDSHATIIGCNVNDGANPNEAVLAVASATFAWIESTANLAPGVMAVKTDGYARCVALTGHDVLNMQGGPYDEKWHGLPFNQIFGNGVPSADASKRSVIYHVIGRAGAGEPDGLKMVVRLADGSYVMDDLNNSAILYGHNTFTGRLQIQGSYSTSGLKVIGATSGSAGDERGAFVVTGDPADSASASIVLRQNDWGAGNIALVYKDHAGTAVTEAMRFSAGGLVRIPNLSLGANSTAPSNAATPAAWGLVNTDSGVFRVGLFQ